MVSIQVDEKTAAKLQALATARGLTPGAVVQDLLAQQEPSERLSITPNSFDEQLDALTFSGPSLPPHFSRADIYDNHD